MARLFQPTLQADERQTGQPQPNTGPFLELPQGFYPIPLPAWPGHSRDEDPTTAWIKIAPRPEKWKPLSFQ